MDWLNPLFFELRNRLCWSRGLYAEPAQCKERLFEGRTEQHTLERLEQRLLTQYPLAHFRSVSTAQRYLETLSILHHLTVLLSSVSKGEVAVFCLPLLRWLDVGAKNWAYVPALAALATQGNGEVRLTGIEVDPYRRYVDWHTRKDYAQTFIQPYPFARYLPGDVRHHHETYEVISWILPFVLEAPALRWGLPRRMFAPEETFAHVVSLLAPGGLLFVINQGEAEQEVQGDLFAKESQLSVLAQCELPPTFLAYQHRRFGWLCQKRASHEEVCP